MAAVTRLGLYGGPRSLYGSFAGKEAQPEPEVVETTGGGWLPKKRKPQKPDWQKRDEERAKFEDVLRNAYAEITGEAPATPVEREITREAIALVAPFVEGGKKRKRPPPVSRVDFERLARNVERAAELIELLDRKRDEEEAVTLLLM